MSGEAIIRVLDPDGSIAYESEPTKNLVLYGGLTDFISTAAGNSTLRVMLANSRAGTGNTPNFTTPTGTYSQAATLVTRATGSVDFVVGDIGKSIKFSTGEVAYITAISSVSVAQVRESATVAATTIVLWNTQQTALGTQVSQTGTLDAGLSVNTRDHGTGLYTTRRVHNHPAEVGTVVYNEVGLARTSGTALFSRLVLNTPVTVLVGQQLQVDYRVTFSLAQFKVDTPVTLGIPGWPRPYVVSSIVHGGASFDVTLSEDHHYSVGDEITISNAIMASSTVSTITSGGSEFTVTTGEAHGYLAADSIVIAGASVGAYNASWTVAGVDSTTVFRVTSGLNPGSATGGTTRETPFPYFNDTWTVASIPSSAVLRVTDATVATGNDTVAGNLGGSLAANCRYVGYYPFNDDEAADVAGWGTPLAKASYLAMGFYTTSAPTGSLGTGTTTPTLLSSGKTYTYDAANHQYGFDGTWSVSEGNSQVIKAIGIYEAATSYGEDDLTILITFDQLQRKDIGYTLQFGYRFSLRPDLS